MSHNFPLITDHFEDSGIVEIIFSFHFIIGSIEGNNSIQWPQEVSILILRFHRSHLFHQCGGEWYVGETIALQNTARATILTARESSNSKAKQPARINISCG